MDRKRGRKSTIEPSELITEILRHKDEVIILGKIAFPSNKVWIDISEKIRNIVSPKGIYTYVQKNRYGIWSQLGIPVVTQKSPEDIYENENLHRHGDEQDEGSAYEDSDTSKDSEDKDVEPEMFKFSIQIPSEEWMQIAPDIASYARKEKRRNYLVLRKGTWTHVVNSQIWDTSRLHCTFSFKRCKVHPRGKNYVTMYGKCTECNTVIKGIIHEEPQINSNVYVSCTASGNFLKPHTLSKKRHLSGNVKKEAIKKMCRENISATLLRTTLSSSCMDLDDSEPSHVPSLNVLRVAKSQELGKNRNNKDPIIAISIAKHQADYLGVIHDICYDRFYVHYWSTAQLHVYRAFCENETYPKICLDATAGLVNKIKRVTGKNSHQIFLYQVVVTDKVTKKQFPVSQMLSERQDTVSIQHWLNQWLQSGAILPKEAVIDMSAAIIGATVRAFTQFSSLEDYIIRCWNIVTNKSNRIQHGLPTCFVRLDVAHILKLVSQWKCLKDTRNRVKEFYMRGIAQLILSKDLETCITLLKALLIVAFSENDGRDPNTNQITECEAAKQKLKNLYSSCQITRVEQFLSEMPGGNITIDDTQQENSDTGLEFQTMASNIVEEIKNTVVPQNDGHDNLQYLPDISHPIIRLFRMLPLWSGIMVSFFNYGSIPASSAAVETNFNILKNMIFSNYTLPIRLDDFLLTHIKSLDGTMKLAAAPIPQLINKKNQDSEEQNFQRDIIDTESNSNNEIVTREYENLNSTDKETSLLKIQSTCPCCSMGNYPDPNGGHKCLICSIPVHALEQCSLAAPDSEEGHGQKRICRLCCKSSETVKRRTLESNEVENWGGLAFTSKKRTYFQPEPKWQNINLSQINNRKPIGVLKNGHRSELKAVKYGKRSFTLSNTCAADSLIQLMAAAIVDSKSFGHFVATKQNNSLFLQLAHYVATKGVTNKAYSLRAKMLYLNSEPEKLPEGIFRLNCETNIGSLAPKLMEAIPCLTEISTCSSQYCPNKERTTTIPVPTIQVKTTPGDGVQRMEQLINEVRQVTEHSTCKSSFENINTVNAATENYILDTSISDFPLCTGRRSINTEMSDKMIVVQLMFSPYEENSSELDENKLAIEILHKVALKEIPLSINVQNNQFHLRGVIGFSHYGSAHNLGHYIAYVLRNDGKWEAYDDMNDKVELTAIIHKIVPHIVMYTI